MSTIHSFKVKVLACLGAVLALVLITGLGESRALPVVSGTVVLLAAMAAWPSALRWRSS